MTAVNCTGGGAAPAAPPAATPDAGQPGPDATGQRGGTLRVGLSTDPLSIDPRFVADAEGELVVGALFEPLVRLDEAGRPVAAAAAAWQVLDDGARFRFRLREASFHDGQPVTADDFVRSFTRLLDPRAVPPSYLDYLLEPVVGADDVARTGGEVEGLRALADDLLEIELVSPQPGFLVTLADPSLVPLPPEAEDDVEAFGRQPIGNGPFAMTEPREPGQFLRLTRVPDHHRRPHVDEVVLSVYPDGADREAQWRDLLDGQVHVAEVAPERLDDARERFGESEDGYTGPGVLDGVGATVYLYGFDLGRAPFDDVRARRAVSLAIDRARLAAEVLPGSRVPATGVVPPSVPGAQTRACRDCRHAPAEARALWEELVAEGQAVPDPEDGDPDGADPDADADGDGQQPGMPGEDAAPQDDGTEDAAPEDDGPEDAAPGEDAPEDAAPGDGAGEDADPVARPAELSSIRLTHNRGRTHAAIAERLAADLESALDVEVTFEALDLGPFVQRVRSGEAALFRLGWEPGQPDPGAYLAPLFHSREIGRENLTGYADEEVDALLDEARALADPADARGRYRQAERRILHDLPVLPLLWYRQTRVVAPDVVDLRWPAHGPPDLAAVSLTSPG